MLEISLKWVLLSWNSKRVIIWRIIFGQVRCRIRDLHASTTRALKILKFVPEAQHHLAGDKSGIVLRITANSTPVHDYLSVKRCDLLISSRIAVGPPEYTVQGDSCQGAAQRMSFTN